MIYGKALDIDAIPITSTTYKGTTVDVTGVNIRPLSLAGKDENGKATYSLRMVTVDPGCEIPLHSHAYLQTLWVKSGIFECWVCDPDTDEVTETCICAPGDYCYNPGHEPHGMRNISDEPGVFVCGIGYAVE